MSPHNHSTAHLLLQGNPNPRTLFKTRLSRQNQFSLAKSLGRDEMLQDGALPQGGSQQCCGQERQAFSFTYCFPLTWVATKGKDSTSKQESRVRGSSEPDTKVTEDACDTEPGILHHNREDAVTLELSILQATQTWKLEPTWHKVGNDAIPYQEVNATMYFANLGNNCKNVCIKTQMHTWRHIHVGINISNLSQYPTSKVNSQKILTK